MNVLWVMPLWGVLYCLVERLVLKSFGTKWFWNLVLMIPRLALSLAIALVVGLPMAQVIYSGSINDELSRTTTARVHQATAEITRTYDTKVAAAQKEIAAAQAREASLRKQVTNSRFLSECEAGETSCSETHKLGCGPYCKRYAREAAAAAAALRTARPQIAATIAADRRRIALWRSTESAQISSRVTAIQADRDFLSRQAALERVEKANPAVTKYVEFFLAFLIAIDLVALVLKLTHLFSTGGAYERSGRGAAGDRPRRGEPPPGACRHADAPHRPRGPGRRGRGRACGPGRAVGPPLLPRHAGHRRRRLGGAVGALDESAHQPGRVVVRQALLARERAPRRERERVADRGARPPRAAPARPRPAIRTSWIAPR